MISAEERFWARVERGTGDSCWLWTGSKTPKGYGHMRINGKNVYVHRLSYQIHHGPIPDKIEVCHTCDNPPCINPSHLFLGTHAENIEDSKKKGRRINCERGPGKRNGEKNNMKRGLVSYKIIKSGVLARNGKIKIDSVCAEYSDGSARRWTPKEKGFKAACQHARKFLSENAH